VAFQHVRRGDRLLQSVHDNFALIWGQQSFGRNDLARFLGSRRRVDFLGHIGQGRTSAAEPQDGNRQEKQMERFDECHVLSGSMPVMHLSEAKKMPLPCFNGNLQSMSY